MKERNHFYIYTLDLRIDLRVESQNIQIYVNALHSISLSFRPVLTQHAGHFEQTYRVSKKNFLLSKLAVANITADNEKSAIIFLTNAADSFCNSYFYHLVGLHNG